MLLAVAGWSAGLSARAVSPSEFPPLGLVVCTNSNICGKPNPGMDQEGAGYGFAYRSIECLRVLGPPNLDVMPGPCFIRCSRGVNAKLVLGSGASGERGVVVRERFLKDGCPYFRLNSIDLCVRWLEDTLNVSPPPELLEAYSAYAAACTLLGDEVHGPIRGDVSYDFSPVPASSAAIEALPALNVAAEYVLSLPAPGAGTAEGGGAAPGAAWPPTPASERRAASFAGAWRESFYASTMVLSSPAELAARQAVDSADGTGASTLSSFAGASAAEADAALEAVRLSSSRSGLAPPTEVLPSGTEAKAGGELRGTYLGGQAKVFGVVTTAGAALALRGRWEEDGGHVGGELELHLSDDGLSFDGRARETSTGDSFEWSGERVAEAGRSVRGSAEQRWRARVLSLRSRALLTLGRNDEAITDAAYALRTCPWLPLAWEVSADAAFAVGDLRSAVVALQELLYLQPAATPGLPLRVTHVRREQAFKLKKLQGEVSPNAGGAQALQSLRGASSPSSSSSSSSNSLALYLLLGDFGSVRGEFTGDALEGRWEALFADEYAAPPDTLEYNPAET
jgi:hypothetical protein